eukprot:jgi/Chrzof1/6573/Cz19g01160.t1
MSKPGPSGWTFYNKSTRTEVEPQHSYVLYNNLWYNGGRWYALVDGDKHVEPWKFSKNQEIMPLHVKDAQQFADSVKWRVVTGDSLLFDYIYFVHPTAIGHWWEMMAPLFGVLGSIKVKRPVDQFILLHLKRSHLMEWVRAVMAVALGVGLHQELPPVLLQQETHNVWQQLSKYIVCSNTSCQVIVLLTAVAAEMFVHHEPSSMFDACFGRAQPPNWQVQETASALAKLPLYQLGKACTVH